MRIFFTSSLLFGAIAFAGCGGSSSSAPGDLQPANSTASAQPNVVAPQSGAQPTVGNAVGTEPGEVVAVFLDSLRRGDENAANAVLTALAQEELKKTDFVIQPLGTPEGTYQVGRIALLPDDKTVALVECKWIEPSAAGAPPSELDIVCEVHQEQPGWRIAGIGVKEAGSDDTMVLDFEDGKSLQAVIEQATNPRPQQAANLSPAGLPQMQIPPQITQTLQPGSQLPASQQTFTPTQLPQLPSQFGTPEAVSVESTSPPQIALPPLPNGPIQR